MSCWHLTISTSGPSPSSWTPPNWTCSAACSPPPSASGRPATSTPPAGSNSRSRGPASACYSARYLDAEPSRVEFGTSDTGKPTLPGTRLSFNVSHTQGLALIAVSAGREIGVDVERVRSQPTHLDMATRYFTPGEARRLNALPPSESERAFFHVWTRKEAFLKAIGLGLSHGLERFEVAVPPDEPCRLLHIDNDAHAAATWTLWNLEPASGYVGALAVEGTGYEIEMSDWPPASP